MLNKILSEGKAAVEQRIDELFPEQRVGYSEVLKAARYSLLLGGKRIRPIVLFELCKMLDGDIKQATDYAVALEMIHTYSLIHDDLPCMDNDDMRRGNPSCHKAFGEDIALLAGDTLLTQAFLITANAQNSSENNVLAVKILGECAGLHGMIGGQVLDLSFEKTVPTADQLADMYAKKTSALLIAAAKLGCVAAGRTDSQTLENAQSYAMNLGLAFQVIDDILDVVADEAVLGKPVGSDDKNNKTTFVALYGLENAKQKAEEYTSAALAALEKLEGDMQPLYDLTNYLLNRKS